MIYIDEIFGNAIQGEGLEMGTPAIFIRVGGCNLTCKGFNCKEKSPLDNSEIIGCDSIHAVNRKHFKHTWKKYYNSFDLINDIKKVLPTKKIKSELPLIIFTGGEPILYHQSEIMTKTIEYFISKKYRVLFETNATINIDFNKYPIYKKCIFSMSVKMSTSGEAKNKRWKPEIVDNYLKNTKNSHFKFVLSSKSIKEDEYEILNFLNQVPTFGLVYVMPKGETSEEISKNAKSVYEFACKFGFRYSDRLHIRIYENKRGV
jgi:organic radical activating enzyme